MKRYFLSRSGREKALLLAFAGIAAIIWLFSATGRIRVLWQERNSLQAEHETQQTWLANRTAIEARAAAAVHQLDPAQTLNGTRLVGELNALANSAGLSAEVSGQRTERTVTDHDDQRHQHRTPRHIQTDEGRGVKQTGQQKHRQDE